MRKPIRAIVCLLIVLDACTAPDEVTAPGDPPLSGNWVPTQLCGIDVACSLELRLSGTTIAGKYWETVNVGKPFATTLHGTYNAPNVHFEYGNAPYTIAFDGVVQGDTLLVGTETWTSTADAHPASYRKVH